MRDPVLLQRNYYRTTADQYDRMHNNCADSHAFALAVLVSMIDFFGIQSILDVGSGTGRAYWPLKVLIRRSAWSASSLRQKCVRRATRTA